MAKLFQLRRGAGEPLLLIMGMGGHHQMWHESFLTLLEGDFDLLLFDHRGIGTSDRADARFSTAELADDAVALLDEAGWSSAHVFGISMGGLVAQELALAYPERVRTLALGCTFAGKGADFSAPGPQRFAEAGATRDAELAVRTGFEVNLSAAYRADPANFEVFRESSLAVRVPVPVVMMQLQAALEHDALARLPKITAPALVMHGTEDDMVVVGNGKQLASAIPGARLEIFEGAGHLFWWESPERAAALLREHAGVGRPTR
jgi:3-oxoadipate enol-lactonase